MSEDFSDSDWCEARRLLLSAPTGERIEFHAKELVSRALGIRPPVAFVGAGASMAYGRISWGDAVRSMQTEVLREATSISPTGQSWRPLYELLDRVKFKPGAAGDNRDLLVAFQLSEQLDTALDPSRPSPKPSHFRERLKTLLGSDFGHAQHIIDSALKHIQGDNFSLPQAEFELRRVVPGDENKNEAADDVRSVRFFKGVMGKLAGHIEGPCCEEVLAMFGAFSESLEQDEFLRPYHRFVIGSALRLVGRDQRRSCIGQPWWAASPPTQGDTLPLERDPLRLLRSCEISRFLTTNYDREIDECLKREGLAQIGVPPDDSPPRNQLSRYWRYLVFDRHHVGNLLAFAARDGRRIVEVVHLHGRADQDNTMIVTSDDYQRHYLSVDEQRAGMDDALAAAFGGNPILFVGSGMGEDDLLRPLRQFIRDSVPGANRLFIAIVPAAHKGGDAAIDLEKLRNLQRYGVYTIHTGNAEPNNRPDDTAGDQKEQTVRIPTRWLTRIAELRRLLDNAMSPKGTTDLQKAACKAALEWMTRAFLTELVTVPDELEGVSIKRYPGLDLKCELGVINYAVAICRQGAAGNSQLLAELQGRNARWVDALHDAIEGVLDSIIGAFLCARLIRMSQDYSDFTRRCMQLPRAEDPTQTVRDALQRPSDKIQRDHTDPIWRRHAVYLAEPLNPADASSPNQPDRDPKDSDAPWRRFYAGAPSQTFNQLLGCLSQKRFRERLRTPPTGRRLFVFIARRGVGKGHFFAALSTKVRLEQFREAIGNFSHSTAKESLEVPRWPAAFFNCGLSHEVTSIFDQFAEVLLQSIRRILHNSGIREDSNVQAECDRWNGLTKLEDEAGELGRNRIGRLRHILEQIPKRHLLGERERILIGISGLSVLFDRDGYPKNAQAKQLMDLLLGDVAAETPIDLVLVSGERRLPRVFRSKLGLTYPHDGTELETRELVELRRTVLPPRRDVELAYRTSRVATKTLEAQIAEESGEPVKRRVDEAYVHFLAPTRASIMSTAYFPSVALVIAMDAGLRRLNADDAQRLGVDHRPEVRVSNVHLRQFDPDRAVTIRKGIKQALDGHSNPAEAPEGDVDKPKEEFPQILARAALLAARGELWDENLLPKSTDRPQPIPTKKVSPPKAAPDPLLKDAATAIDNQMKALFVSCGKSRFGFTVLMAAAYEHLVKVANSKQAKPDDMRAAIEGCARFLSDAQLKLDGTAEARRVEAILEITLAGMARFDRQQDRSFPADCPRLRPCRELFDFQRDLLWQLAIIGQPVVAEVLARSPMVMRFYTTFKKTPPTIGPPEAPFTEWCNIARECLSLLEERCLVFPIRVRAPEPVEDMSERRYMVHHQLQCHIFRRLHAPFVEYPEADQFAVTLFASQPNDVPRLTVEARANLHLTVSALIGDPDADTSREAFPPWPVLESNPPSEADTKALNMRALLLRAALGIVRSVYSLSTIVRALPSPPSSRSALHKSTAHESGVLERHRTLIHWMIRQAQTHDDHTATLPNIRKAFYAEEIAWLYNEAGVLSYAQGHMIEARIFLDRATLAVQQIEPDESGAVRTRITLNGVLTDIERGRLTLAEASLATIRRIKDEHPAVLRMAAGLDGLVDHLRGRYQSAERHYKEALEDGESEDGTTRLGLVTLERTRAASIIARHYGDMLRTQGKYKEAGEKIKQSTTLAIEGGHEDIRHQARLASLWLELMPEAKEQERQLTADGYHIHKELDVVEDFANLMGMPRLQCEVDLIRARLRQDGGDLQAAATVASRGLTLASANDLRLRKTRFLLRLAEIFDRQGKIEECSAVLTEAFDLARESDYHSAREQGQVLYARISTRRSG